MDDNGELSLENFMYCFDLLTASSSCFHKTTTSFVFDKQVTHITNIRTTSYKQKIRYILTFKKKGFEIRLETLKDNIVVLSKKDNDAVRNLKSEIFLAIKQKEK